MANTYPQSSAEILAESDARLHRQQEETFKLRERVLTMDPKLAEESLDIMRRMRKHFDELMFLLTPENIRTVRQGKHNGDSISDFNQIVFRYFQSVKVGNSPLDKLEGASTDPDAKVKRNDNFALFRDENGELLSVNELRERDERLQLKLECVHEVLKKVGIDNKVPKQLPAASNEKDQIVFNTIRELVEDIDTMQIEEKLTKEETSLLVSLRDLALARHILLQIDWAIRRENTEAELTFEQKLLVDEARGEQRKDGVFDSTTLPTTDPREKLRAITNAIEEMRSKHLPDFSTDDLEPHFPESLLQEFEKQYQSLVIRQHNIDILEALRSYFMEGGQRGYELLSSYRRTKQLITLASMRYVLARQKSPNDRMTGKQYAAAQAGVNYRSESNFPVFLQQQSGGSLPHPEVLRNVRHDYQLASSSGNVSPEPFLLDFRDPESLRKIAKKLGVDDWEYLRRLGITRVLDTVAPHSIRIEKTSATRVERQRGVTRRHLGILGGSLAAIGLAAAGIYSAFTKPSGTSVARNDSAPVVKPDDVLEQDPFIGVPEAQYDAEEERRLLAEIAHLPRPAMPEFEPNTYPPTDQPISVQRSLQPDPLRDQYGRSDFAVDPFDPDQVSPLPPMTSSLPARSDLADLRRSTPTELATLLEQSPRYMKRTPSDVRPSTTSLASIDPVTPPALTQPSTDMQAQRDQIAENARAEAAKIAAAEAQRVERERAEAARKAADEEAMRLAAEQKAQEEKARIAAEQETMRLAAEKAAEEERARVAQEKKQRLQKIQELNTQIDNLFVKAEDPQTSAPERDKIIAELEKLIAAKEELEKAKNE